MFLFKEIKENSHNDEKPKDDVDKEMENIFGLNSPHEKDDNLAIKSSKTDDIQKESTTMNQVDVEMSTNRSDIDASSQSEFNGFSSVDENISTTEDSKEIPRKFAKPSRKPVKKEDGKSQLPIIDRPRRQMKRKISENEDSKPKEKTVGTTKKKSNKGQLISECLLGVIDFPKKQ